MIESIEFTNFKALRKTTLPLAPFTLLLGPNGSGKSSVLQAIQGIASIARQQPQQFKGHVGVIQGPVWSPARSATVDDPAAPVEIKLRFWSEKRLLDGTFQWH